MGISEEGFIGRKHWDEVSPLVWLLERVEGRGVVASLVFTIVLSFCSPLLIDRLLFTASIDCNEEGTVGLHIYVQQIQQVP
jgi:hypothetical protein